MIIAILLWLQGLSPNTQYTQAEYNAMVVANQQCINQALQDQALQDQIWDQHGASVPTIVVVE